jgi:hypothetical protein
MKLWAAVAGLALVLAGARAEAIRWGVGVTGGASFPLAQSDNAAGTQFGLRVPVHVVPLLTVEPFLTGAGLGGVEASFAGRPYNRRGLDVLGWGAVAAWGDLGFGTGFPIHPYVGVGSYHLSREGTGGSDETGWTLGVGWSRALPWRVAVGARAEFTWIADGETARRFIGLGAGISVPLHTWGKKES